MKERRKWVDSGAAKVKLPTASEEKIADEPIAGSCFKLESDGTHREFTPEEYAATPRGHIFIGIGGFKPPRGKTYKPDPI